MSSNYFYFGRNNFSEQEIIAFVVITERVEQFMGISYKPLWHQLIEKDIKKMAFRDMVGISNGTLARLGKNDPVSLDVIEKICVSLNCKIEDVVQITSDENE